MKTLFSIALGILAAIGGYVDIGDLVFNTTAGATFGYQLLWAVVLGVGGIIVYAEMCGRVAAVSSRAVFDVVRERLGFSVGLVTLVGAMFVSLLTLAAEVGGIAIALQLLFGHSYRLLIAVAVIGLALVLWTMPFGWIERVFGYGGLCLLVLLPAMFKLHPDWSAVAQGFVPHAHTGNMALYLYYVVGLVGAGMTPYEVYFYSSGAVEEQWTADDLTSNRLNAIVGYTLGGILSFALVICSGALFLPHGVSPELLGSVALVVQSPLGAIGLVLMLVGIAFAVSGAAIDTAFSGAYNLAQFFGWEWGKYRHNAGAPRFTISWIVMLVLACGIVMTGYDPIKITEFAVIFSVVALPTTYLPILLVANDRAYMGAHRNGRLANGLGIFYLAVIVLVALAAIPLMVDHKRGPGMTVIDLGLGILDHQLIDSEGRRCGKVDDLELDGVRVKAIVVGGTGWRGRGRLGRLTARLAGGRAVLVPWSEARGIDSAVQLSKPAAELGLGRGDERARRWVERIPGSGL